jgi:hypothetical protein
MAKTEKRTGQKQWPKTSPKAFYLGQPEEKQQCIENLATIAFLLELTGPSDLLRWIGKQDPQNVAQKLKCDAISTKNDAINA